MTNDIVWNFRSIMQRPWLDPDRPANDAFVSEARGELVHAGRSTQQDQRTMT